VRRRAVAGEEEEAAVGALARPEVPGGRVDVRSQRARRAPALAAAAARVDVVRAAGVRAAVRGEEQQAAVGRDPRLDVLAGRVEHGAQVLGSGEAAAGEARAPQVARARGAEV